MNTPMSYEAEMLLRAACGSDGRIFANIKDNNPSIIVDGVTPFLSPNNEDRQEQSRWIAIFEQLTSRRFVVPDEDESFWRVTDPGRKWLDDLPPKS